MTAPATAPGLLETERLWLRGFTDSDADAQLLFDLDSDPEVMRFIGPFGMPTVEAYRERIRTVWLPYYSPHSSRGFWAIIEKDTEQFVGWCFVRPAMDYKFAAEAGWTRPSDLELGYRLRRAAWGRGLATEASAALVHRAARRPRRDVRRRGRSRFESRIDAGDGEDRDGSRPRVRDARICRPGRDIRTLPYGLYSAELSEQTQPAPGKPGAGQLN